MVYSIISSTIGLHLFFVFAANNTREGTTPTELYPPLLDCRFAFFSFLTLCAETIFSAALVIKKLINLHGIADLILQFDQQKYHPVPVLLSFHQQKYHPVLLLQQPILLILLLQFHHSDPK